MNDSKTFVKLSETAKLPSRGSPAAAGYDIYSDNDSDIVILPKSKYVIPTGVKMQIPDGYYGQIASRSGLAFKYNVTAFPGVIDADYRGEIAVLLYNNSEERFIVRRGERIAQMIFMKHEIADFIVKDLDESKRGENGFGSTGV